MQFKADHRVTLKRAANNFAAEDISGDVISITTSKTYARAAGGFTISTTTKSGLDKLIKPNDIIHIELDKGDGQGLKSKMIGMASSIHRHSVVSDDQRLTRRINISGMDFGKILAGHNCIVDITPGPGQIGTEQIVRFAKGLLFSGDPQTVVKSIFDKLLVGQLPWVEEYIYFSADSSDANPADDWQTLDLSILESTGAVWSAMKRAANEPYNALSTETVDGKLKVSLERYPFHADTGKLLRQTFTTITEDGILEEDLGLDDSDRVNYVWLKADLVTIYNAGNNIPMQYNGAMNFDLESIKHDGFHPFYPTTNFVPPGAIPRGQNSPDILKQVGTRARTFWNWHRNNHLLESGNLVVTGDPDIRVGGGVIIDRTNMEYFVEGCIDEYTWGKRYVNKLKLTRGQTHGP